MLIKNSKSITDAGNIVNEDIFNISENAAWILDGSSGLTGVKVTDSESDARWFVEAWNKYLMNNINKNESLSSIVEQGISAIKEDYMKFEKSDVLSRLDLPSASIAIIRINGSDVEYFVLGDCSLLYKLGNADLCTIQDSRVTKLDKQVTEKIIKLHEDLNIDILKARDYCLEDLRNNRLLKNTAEGYWILEFDNKAVESALTGSFSAENGVKLCMTSDGFSQYYDTLNICDDEESFFKAVENESFADLLNRIRKVQNMDYQCNRYPRLKKGDDATAVYLEI